MNPLNENRRIARACLVIAVVDYVLAVLCAANGLSEFIYFGILGSLMWILGLILDSKSGDTGE